MNPSSASASLGKEMQIDLICDAFERQWRPDRRPAIEAFLVQSPPGHQAKLFAELLAVEMELRKKVCESPTAAEYEARFPAFVTQIRDVAQRHLRTAVTDPAPTPGGGQKVRAPGGAGRYQFLAELGRGGMGVVYRVNDRTLARPLALKVMKAPAAGEAEQRFLSEARISAQLQHPGIPPIHELGKLKDGRPYFSMKLIDGQTLSALLEARTDRQADLPRFLRIFEQLAQTLGYVHAQGVIHRDLKPLNVMVGAFAEVQLMDWGLACRWQQPAPSTPAASRGAAASVLSENDTTSLAAGKLAGDDTVSLATSAPDSASTDASVTPDRLTQPGQILGTIAYMSPEQARGEVARLDPRSDVFGLGAILCEILTGKPPWTRDVAIPPLTQAQRGDLSAARSRLADCGADAALCELTLACLAPEQAARPATAAIVAERMSSYLASVQARLHELQLQQAAAAARQREQQKRRRVVAALAAVATVFALTIGGALWWYRADRAAQQRDRLARQAEQQRADELRQRDIAQLVTRADDERRAARWKAAEGLLANAASSLRADDPKPLAAQVQASQIDLDFAKSLEEFQIATSFVDSGGYEAEAYVPRFPMLVGTTPSESFFSLVRSYVSQRRPALSALSDVDLLRALVRERELPADLRPQIIAALLLAAGKSRDVEHGADLLLLGAEIDPARDSWNPSRWNDPAAFRQLVAAAERGEAPSMSVNLLCLQLLLRRQPAEALTLAERALVSNPHDSYLRIFVGDLLMKPELGRAQEAMAHYLGLLSAFPESGVAHQELGLRLLNLERFDLAESALRRACQLDPQLIAAHHLLAETLEKAGQPPEKVRECLLLAAAQHPNNAYLQFELGNLMRDAQREAEALPYLERAVALAPDHWGYCMALGAVLLKVDGIERAEPVLQRAKQLALEAGEGDDAEAIDRVLASADQLRDRDRQLQAAMQSPADVPLPELAALAQYAQNIKGDPRLALRLYEMCVEREPKNALGASLFRMQAVQAASLALASSDAAEDADGLRIQAHAWLSQELLFWNSTERQFGTKLHAALHSMTQALLHGKGFAALRALARREDLSALDRELWQTYWNDIHALDNRTAAAADARGPRGIEVFGEFWTTLAKMGDQDDDADPAESAVDDRDPFDDSP